MDKAAHAQRLKEAISRTGHNRETVGEFVGRGPRTITNWTNGTAMPGARERDLLRRLLGPYDETDDLDAALTAAGLVIEWRRYAVMAEIKRHLHEQGRDDAGSAR